jgi:Macrocin-O-methyltransferase (TylF)
MTISDPAPEQSTAYGETFRFREQLSRMYAESPLNEVDRMFNLGLYVRSSLLVKFLVLDGFYRRFKSIPGVLVEFGTWWGQNLVLLENLRAIHEPFNKQRTIIGFDTFSGYPSSAYMPPESTLIHAGYNTTSDHQDYLARLLEVHEGNNAFGHIRGNHKLIRGDVVETAPRYFAEHPETLVAFAFFDMGPYEPTIAALQAIKPQLLPGSVLVFDELTWAGAPGEAIAFKEAFSDMKYTIEKCELYPSKAIVTVQ